MLPVIIAPLSTSRSLAADICDRMLKPLPQGLFGHGAAAVQRNRAKRRRHRLETAPKPRAIGHVSSFQVPAVRLVLPRRLGCASIGSYFNTVGWDRSQSSSSGFTVPKQPLGIRGDRALSTAEGSR